MRSHLSNLRVQCGLCAIAVFNFLINLVPGSFLRGVLLNAIGCSIGKSVGLHPRIRFTWPGRIEIGDDSTINFGVFLDSRGGLSIGRHVMIGHHCSLYTATHDLDSGDFRTLKRPVVVGDWVVIFPHALIMPGVKISEGAVVLPGSVVVKDVPPFTVVGGNPAAWVRDRARNQRYKLDYTFYFPNA